MQSILFASSVTFVVNLPYGEQFAVSSNKDLLVYELLPNSTYVKIFEVNTGSSINRFHFSR